MRTLLEAGRVAAQFIALDTLLTGIAHAVLGYSIPSHALVVSGMEVQLIEGEQPWLREAAGLVLSHVLAHGCLAVALALLTRHATLGRWKLARALGWAMVLALVGDLLADAVDGHALENTWPMVLIRYTLPESFSDLSRILPVHVLETTACLVPTVLSAVAVTCLALARARARRERPPLAEHSHRS